MGELEAFNTHMTTQTQKGTNEGILFYFFGHIWKLGKHLHAIYKTAIVAAMLHFITIHRSYEPLVFWIYEYNFSCLVSFFTLFYLWD